MKTKETEWSKLWYKKMNQHVEDIYSDYKKITGKNKLTRFDKWLAMYLYMNITAQDMFYK